MELAPEIIKMRDALLERIESKSLKETGQIVDEILLKLVFGTSWGTLPLWRR